MTVPQLVPWFISIIILAVLLTILFQKLLFRKNEGHNLQLGELQGRLNQLEKISGSLEELRTLFIVPHTRGGVGETLLEELLRNWLPEQGYSLQYGFQNGNRADAIIRLGNYIVAVDAKFPLQSVRDALLPLPAEQGDAPREIPAQIKRTFIRHARDIAEKYIRPEENTLQFALMYIPSENIYYRCFVEDGDLSASVLKQKVVPVSPSSLFLYIQTVAYGLKGFNFSRKAEKLLTYLYEVQTEMAAFDHTLNTAGTHLRNLTRSFDTLSNQSKRIETLLKRIEKP